MSSGHGCTGESETLTRSVVAHDTLAAFQWSHMVGLHHKARAVCQVTIGCYDNVSTCIYMKDNVMRLLLAKWGNSLALRLPADCLRATGLRQGDSVDAEITPAGTITLTPARSFDKAAFLQRIRKQRRRMPVTAPVVELMRRDARY